MNCYPDENADPEEELDEHLKAELEWEAKMQAEEYALQAAASPPDAASGMIQAVSMLDAKLQASLAREAALQQRLNEADQRIDEAEQLLSRCVMSVREQHCGEDEAEFDLPATLMAEVDAFFSQLTKDSPEVGS